MIVFEALMCFTKRAGLLQSSGHVHWIHDGVLLAAQDIDQLFPYEVEALAKKHSIEYAEEFQMCGHLHADVVHFQVKEHENIVLSPLVNSIIIV